MPTDNKQLLATINKQITEKRLKLESWRIDIVRLKDQQTRMDNGDSRYHTIREAIRTKRADIEEIKSEIGDLIHRKHRINGINESTLNESLGAYHGFPHQEHTRTDIAHLHKHLKNTAKEHTIHKSHTDYHSPSHHNDGHGQTVVGFTSGPHVRGSSKRHAETFSKQLEKSGFRVHKTTHESDGSMSHVVIHHTPHNLNISKAHKVLGSSLHESTLTEEVKWGQTTQGHNGQVQKSFHLKHPNGSVQYHLSHTAHPTHPHSLVQHHTSHDGAVTQSKVGMFKTRELAHMGAVKHHASL